MLGIVPQLTGPPRWPLRGDLMPLRSAPRLSPPDISHAFPEFPAPELDSVLLQDSLTLCDVRALQLAYRRHCEVTAPSPGRTPSPALRCAQDWRARGRPSSPQARVAGLCTLSTPGSLCNLVSPLVVSGFQTTPLQPASQLLAWHVLATCDVHAF